jgi:hypothetical protein
VLAEDGELIRLLKIEDIAGLRENREEGTGGE